MVWVGAVNYFAACLMSVVAWLVVFGAGMGWEDVIYGSAGGATWFVAYLLLNASIRLAGVSIAQCVGWLGVVVPVAASIFLWREMPNASQYVGLALMVVALVLLAPGKTSNVAVKSDWKVPVLLGLFAAEGVINVVIKGFTESLKSQGLSQLDADARFAGALIFMFGVAGLGMLCLGVFKERKPLRGNLPHGLVLGITSFVANYAFIMAVARLHGPVVFPCFWAGTILCTSVAAMVLWKERYSVRAVLGMVVALVTMIFINVNVIAWLRALGNSAVTAR